MVEPATTKVFRDRCLLETAPQSTQSGLLSFWSICSPTKHTGMEALGQGAHRQPPVSLCDPMQLLCISQLNFSSWKKTGTSNKLWRNHRNNRRQQYFSRTSASQELWLPLAHEMLEWRRNTKGYILIFIKFQYYLSFQQARYTNTILYARGETGEKKKSWKQHLLMTYSGWEKIYQIQFFRVLFWVQYYLIFSYLQIQNLDDEMEYSLNLQTKQS